MKILCHSRCGHPSGIGRTRPEPSERRVHDENVYPVSIEENGKTYNVENEAGKGFINEARKGHSKLLRHLLTAKWRASLSVSLERIMTRPLPPIRTEKS